MDLGLAGRTVIVTGASGGIGRHITRQFAAEGASVVLTCHRSRADADALAAEIGARALVVPFDMADPTSADTLVKAALVWAGRVDVLVNNAVVWGAPPSDRPFEALTEDEWLTKLRVNTEGAIRLTRAVAPLMRERRWGRLVHVSSRLATDGAAGTEYYSAAKAALHGFSRSLAFSLGRAGDILSNVVLPGLTRTDTNGPIVEAAGDMFSARSAVGRLLDAAEVAGPVVYLGSAANTGITGELVTVTGGA